MLEVSSSSGAVRNGKSGSSSTALVKLKAGEMEMTFPQGDEVQFYDGLGVRKGIEGTPLVHVPGPVNMLSLLQQKARSY